MRSVLVTGANGLLGRHIVQLLSQDSTVYAVGRTAPAAAPNVVPVALDLARSLEPAALPKKVDAVIHLAQSSRFREFPDAAQDIFQVNTAQIVALLKYARKAGARNFVIASTGGVYASSSTPLTERAQLVEPMGFYPASKRAAEILAWPFCPYLNVVILRYFFIYGPGQKREMLLPRLVDSVRKGRAVSLQGENGLHLNPVHAEDAACATASAASLDRSAIVNVAGPETLSLRQICDIIGDRVGKEPIFDARPHEKPGDLIGDTSLMSELLVPPKRRFRDGLTDLL